MTSDTENPRNEPLSVQQGVTLPVLEERLEISKRVVTTGTVRLQKHAEQHEESVSVPLTETRWQVERVAMDRIVTAPPDIRHEGETTIYPVVEERVVITRELVLTEEVHVTRILQTRTETSSHTVMRERIEEHR